MSIQEIAMSEQEKLQDKQISRRDLLKMLGSSAAGASLAKVAGLSGAATALLQGMPAAAQSKVEVWTGFGQGRMADALTGSLEQFNMSQGEFVAEHIVVPWGEIHDRVIAATSAGSPPDSYRGWSWIVGDAAIGALTNLQSHVDAANVDLMDFWPATLNQMQYQGDVHAMSISTIVQFLFYNKDRMREGGLDPDSPPTTIAELDEQGAALNEIADDGEILRLGFAPTLPGKQVWDWGAAFGSQYWDEAEGNIALDEEAWIALLNWYKGYGDKFGVENLAGYASTYGGNGFGRNSPQGIYYTGLISFWVIGSWLFNDMGEYGPDVDFGVTPIPTLASADDATPGTSIANMYFVPANCANPDGGFAFANFMSSSPYVAINKALPDSVMPSRPSLASLPEVAEQGAWTVLARDEILPNTLERPSFPGNGFLGAALNQAVDNVMFNDADPAEVIADAVARSRREVERLRG
jgi:multiple sugar transport system substrate-binding protein